MSFDGEPPKAPGRATSRRLNRRRACRNRVRSRRRRRSSPYGRATGAVRRLLARVLERVRGRLISRQRAAVVQRSTRRSTIRCRERGELPAQRANGWRRRRSARLVGLGLIDRLWSDRTVRAIFVNGPHVGVRRARRRAGRPVGRGLRDEAHLLELIGPAGRAAGERDGGLHACATARVGVVIFPPVAPTGPVLTLRRAEPGEATLERLVRERRARPAGRRSAASRGAQPAQHAGHGPAGSGKTALLAAVVRDLDAGAARGDGGTPSPVPLGGCVQGRAGGLAGGAVFGADRGRGAVASPALLVLDSVHLEDVAALVRASAARRAGHPGVGRAGRDVGGAGAVGRSRRAHRSRQRRAVPGDGGGRLGRRRGFRHDDGELARGTALRPSPRPCRREATATR